VAALETVLEQALQLTDDERGELIAHLLRSLEPDDGEAVIGDEWEAAWSTELDNRVREIRDGSTELIDGDAARARVRAAINARRP
jgi:putative addiction module component (TIGR02574 family)